MAHKPKILVVEDQPAILQQLDLTLRSMGADPRCYSSSREAATRIGREKFDGAFLDWDTPELKGEELTQMIRRSPSNSRIPIAMLTERHDTRSIARGFAMGVTFFFSKPLGAKELGRLLNASRGAMLEERRRYQRAPLRVPVTCFWDEKQIEGESENVSASGMLINLPQAPRPNGAVQVDFSLPGVDSDFFLRAKVARVVQGPKIGIHFVGIARDDRQKLARVVDRTLNRSLRPA